MMDMDHIQKLLEENQKLREENKNLKNELVRVKEDKAENEAMYERVIKSYKEKLNALYGSKTLRDYQEETYQNIISKLK